jgi:hypothetical protein
MNMLNIRYSVYQESYGYVPAQPVFVSQGFIIRLVASRHQDMLKDS